MSQHTQQTENELAQQAANGDSMAMGQLYDAYNNEIFRFVRLRVKEKEQAEDITSAIFLKVVTSIKSFNPKKASFRTWLYIITKRTLIDFYRHNKETTALEDQEITQEDTQIKVVAEINLILSTLTPEQKEIITLRLLQDLSFAEIATVMKKTEGATKIFFYRTMKEITKQNNYTLLLFLALTYATTQ